MSAPILAIEQAHSTVSRFQQSLEAASAAHDWEKLGSNDQDFMHWYKHNIQQHTLEAWHKQNPAALRRFNELLQTLMLNYEQLQQTAVQYKKELGAQQQKNVRGHKQVRKYLQ